MRQYTSQGEILKYTKATAGCGISYLLDHDYKALYLEALTLLPQQTRERGIRILEFGCGGGMNLLHLVSVLNSKGIQVADAVGTDFSPVMIETAKREAKNHLQEQDLPRLEFYVAKNESLIADLSASAGIERSRLRNSLHFILGVNTVRYCHDAKKEMDNARDIFDLLVPRGVCVVIDMNNRFPLEETAAVLCSILGRVRLAICQSRFRGIAKRALLLDPAFCGCVAPWRYEGVVSGAQSGRQIARNEIPYNRKKTGGGFLESAALPNFQHARTGLDINR